MKPTVLVVDDERLVRTSLRSRLEEEGYRVLEAETGALLIDQGEEEVAESRRFLLHRVEVDAIEGVEGGVEGGEAENRRGTALESVDARPRLVVGLKGERGAVHQPPREG